MIIPIRCFSCGKVTGNKWEPYVAHLKAGKNKKEALDLLGLTRPCCRSMILTHVPLIDKLLRFKSMEVEQVELDGNKIVVGEEYAEED